MNIEPQEKDSEPDEYIFEQIVEEYFALVDSKKMVNRNKIRNSLFEKYSEWKKDLVEFFEREDSVAGLANQLDSDRNGENSEHRLTQVRLGDYQLMDSIGRGGMGEVFRAKQLSTSREVAVKLLRYAGSELRFRREIEIAAQLDHPNIVSLYEAGSFDGRLYFSMKLAAGSIANQGSCPPKKIANQILLVARALEYAHQRGILHRDVKPENILIDENQQPMLADFGLAYLDSSIQLTDSHGIVGTVHYMSPEQAEGRSVDLTASSDVYSLGATLYCLLTQKLPFESENTSSLILKIQREYPESIRIQRPDVSVDLERICLKCLEKKPRDRYHSAAELAEDLQNFIDGMPVKARPLGIIRKSARWVEREPVLATAIMVILLILGIGGPIIAFQQSQLRHQIATSQQRERLEQIRGLADSGNWDACLHAISRWENSRTGDQSLPFLLLKYRALEATEKTEKSRATLEEMQKHADYPDDNGLVQILTALQELRADKTDYARKLNSTREMTGESRLMLDAILAKYPDKAIDPLTKIWADGRNQLHHQAGRLLAVSLLLSGRIEEAAVEARLLKQYYPDDSSANFILAWLAAIKKDESKFKTQIASLKNRVSPEDLGDSKTTIDNWLELNRLIPKWRLPATQIRITGLFNSVVGEKRLTGPKKNLLILPCFRYTYGRIYSELNRWNANPSNLQLQQLLLDLNKLTEEYEDSSIHFLVGSLQWALSNNLKPPLKQNAWRQAIKSYDRCLSFPTSLPNLHLDAHLWRSTLLATFIAYNEFTERRQDVIDSLIFYHAKVGKFPSDQLHIFLDIARVIGDTTLIRLAVTDAIIQGKTHLPKIQFMIRNLHKKGKHGDSLLVLEQVLKAFPDDAKTKSLRSELFGTQISKQENQQ